MAKSMVKGKDRAIRMIIDTAMVILLPMLMAYSLIGELFHEIAGTLMLILFIAHHIVNRKWFGSILKGSYGLRRSISVILNLLLLIIMLLLPVSGILMSRHLYTFIPYMGMTFYARTIHMMTAYWGFILMCVHLGLHLNGMVMAFNKNTPKSDEKNLSGKELNIRKLNIKRLDIKKSVVLIIAVGISAYGMYAFRKRDLATYLFMKNQFVMFDFYEAKVKFFVDYIAMMIMITTVTYLLSAVYTKLRFKRRRF